MPIHPENLHFYNPHFDSPNEIRTNAMQMQALAQRGQMDTITLQNAQQAQTDEATKRVHGAKLNEILMRHQGDIEAALPDIVKEVPEYAQIYTDHLTKAKKDQLDFSNATLTGQHTQQQMTIADAEEARKVTTDQRAADAIKQKQSEEEAGTIIPGTEFTNEKQERSSLFRVRKPDGTYQNEVRVLGKQGAPPQNPPQPEAPRSPERMKQDLQLKQTEAGAGAGPMFGSAATPAPPNATPDQILGRYPVNVQGLAKMLVQYKAPMPSGMALANPKSAWNAALTAAGELDPTFDAKQYKARQNLLNDFTSGKAAANIRSINTAIAHLDNLKKAADRLSNYGFQTANTIKNAIKSEAGDSAVNNYNIAADAVSGELTTAFRGTNGNQADVAGWRKSLNTSNGPEKQTDSVKEAVSLLGGRLYALQSQYEQGMGRPADFSILSPKSRATLQRMGIDPSTVETGPMNANNPSTQPFNNGAPAAPAAPAGPKVGDTQSHQGANYRFDGKVWVKQK